VKNNELLLKAIDSFDKFTKSQKSILTIVIEFLDENDRANIAIESIVQISHFTKAIIYRSLTKLEKSQYITREKEPKEQIGYIRINRRELNAVVEFYTKKQQMITKNIPKTTKNN
jgi:predicted transcriptional regulator